MDHTRITELNNAIVENPRQVEPRLELAQFYLDRCCYREALEQLEQAFALIPNHPDLATNIAAIAVNLDDREKAGKYFELAAELAPNSIDCQHNLGLYYASAGELPKARMCFEKIIFLSKDDAQAHSDLAVILADLGESENARRHFLIALELNPFYEKGLSNFLEFCLKQKDFGAALEAIEKYLRLVPQNAEFIRWQQALRQIAEDKDKYVDQDELLRPLRGRNVDRAGLKLVFFEGDYLGNAELLKHLSRRHTVRIFRGNTLEELRASLNWADLAWFEGCGGLLAEAASLPKYCAIVCRISNADVSSDWPARINWAKIDRIVTTTEYVDTCFRKKYPRVRVLRQIIPEGVDTQRFRPAENKAYGRNFCAIGKFSEAGQVGLMLQCFHAIQSTMPDCKFFLTGDFADLQTLDYIQQMAARLNLPVKFDPASGKLSDYLLDKDFIVSAEISDRDDKTLAQAMACGVVPLIHSRPGAEFIYPEQYLYDSPQECARRAQILLDAGIEKAGGECRAHIIHNLSIYRYFYHNEAVIQGLNLVPKAESPMASSHPLLPAKVEKTALNFGKASILVLVDEGRYLADCLASIKSQSYEDYEIVLLCTQAEQIEKIKANYPNLQAIVAAANQTPFEILVRAMRSCSGNIIAWLKDTDLWLPERLENGMQMLCENPEAALQFADYYCIDVNSRIVGRSRMLAPTIDMLADMIWKQNFIALSTVLIRRPVLEELLSGLGKIDCHHHETAAGLLCHRLAQERKARFHTDPLAFVRMEAEQHLKQVDLEKDWNQAKSRCANEQNQGKGEAVSRCVAKPKSFRLAT